MVPGEDHSAPSRAERESLDPLTLVAGGRYRSAMEMGAEESKLGRVALDTARPPHLQQQPTTPSPSLPEKAEGVSFVRATPGNFLGKLASASPRLSSQDSLGESPVPSSWSRSKELAAEEAASLPPGASLSALIGQRLANGLRLPSKSATPQPAALTIGQR